MFLVMAADGWSLMISSGFKPPETIGHYASNIDDFEVPCLWTTMNISGVLDGSSMRAGQRIFIWHLHILNFLNQTWRLISCAVHPATQSHKPQI